MSNKVKYIVVILILGLAAAVANPQSRGMSPAFREKARRALDAIRRLPLDLSADAYDPSYDQRKIDVEKAIDEAKYKTRTASDKQVLKILKAADFLMGAAKKRHALDPDWQPLREAALQCKVELTAEFEPASLSSLGRRHAAEKTCLKKQDAIIRLWEQQIRR